MQQATCGVCRGPLPPGAHGNRKYCSPDCADAALGAKRAEWKQREKDGIPHPTRRTRANPRQQRKPLDAERICSRCGEPFAPWRLDQHRCSPCSEIRRGKPVSMERTCAVCAAPFSTYQSLALYCSRRCNKRAYYARLSGVPWTPMLPPRYKLSVTHWRPCAICSTPTSRPRYCSSACATEAMRLYQHAWYREHRAPPTVEQACHECGTQFSTPLGLRRYCSATCATRSTRRRARQRRRARKQAVPHEAIDLPTLATRDGWRCHICKRKVTRATWSVDHLIPLSHGGHHTYDNVALAHHRCNSLRGDHGSAQLRLAA